MKIAIAVLLSTALLYVHSKPVMNQKELRAWYNTYSRDYFGSSLKDVDVEIQWLDMHDERKMGKTQCWDDHCLISLDPSYNEAFPAAKATLLHEMCHVKTRFEVEEHGPKWDTCMDTLWVEGAFKGLV